jgi:hypothetical protein
MNPKKSIAKYIELSCIITDNDQFFRYTVFNDNADQGAFEGYFSMELFNNHVDELVKSQKVKKWPHQTVIINYHPPYNLWSKFLPATFYETVYVVCQKDIPMLLTGKLNVPGADFVKCLVPSLRAGTRHLT